MNDAANEPALSVVIACYYTDATLPDQLTALCEQQDAPSFEVLLSDNEGSATLPAVAEPFRARLDLRIIAAQDARGQTHARNVGVRAARSTCIAFCDADDVVGPQWVSAAHRALSENDTVVTGPLRLDVLNPEHSWRTYLHVGDDVAVPAPVLQEPFGFLGYERFAVGCNLGVRKSTFEAVGGFDESVLGGTEDVELSWKLIESGRGLTVDPDMLVDYRLRTTPAAIFRQRRSYSRSQLRLWAISRELGRPVRDMSLRWAVTETAKLPAGWVRTRTAPEADRFRYAAWAGAVAGNLEGQLRHRVLPRLAAPLRKGAAR